eukprot:g4597.t1
MSLRFSTLSTNTAVLGGAVYGTNAHMNITNCVFGANLANRSGSAIYMEQSSAIIENTAVRSNEALENCGGICVYRMSMLEASNLVLRLNSAGNEGGGIGIVNSSFFLCYSCTILNNRALKGAGLYAYSNNSILVVAQFQNSQFANNSAQLYGGAILFDALTKGNINCSFSNVTCGRIILLNTSFVANNALQVGAIVLTTHASGVLINCNYMARRKKQLLKQRDFNSLESLDPKGLCKEWTGNQVLLDNYERRVVGTYGKEIQIYTDPDHEVRYVKSTKGYEGLLCSNCKDGYGRNARFLCVKLNCPNTSLSLLIIVAVTAYLLATAAVTIRGCLPLNSKPQNDLSSSDQSSSDTSPSDRDPEVNIEMVRMLVEGYVPQQHSEMEEQTSTSFETQTSTNQKEKEFELTKWKTTEILKIMINFLQTIAVAATVNVPWTQGMLSLFESSEYIGAMTFGILRPVDCLGSTNSTSSKEIWKIRVALIIPLSVICVFCAFWGYVATRNGKGLYYFGKRCLLSAITVVYISYFGLTKMAVRAFYCIDVHDSYDYFTRLTHKVWAMDISIRCYGKDHFEILIVSLFVLIVVTVCFPLYSFLVLLRNKESLRIRDSLIFETNGFLYRAFKEKLSFWESIVMFRKACLSLIVVYQYPLGGETQGALASALLLLSLYAHLNLRPYREELKSLNQFESCSLLISCLTFILGLTITNSRNEPPVMSFLTVIIILGNVIFFLTLLLALFYNSMVHLRVALQCENVPLPVPPTWWNILKVYIALKLAQMRQQAV